MVEQRLLPERNGMAKKGKYAHITPTLPRLPAFDEEDPKYQDKVDAKKRQLLAGDPENGIAPIRRHASALAEHYADVREYRDLLKQKLKEVNIEVDATVQLLTEQYEAEGITALTLSDGAVIRLQAEPYAQIKDPAKVREWALNDPDLRNKVTLHWQTLNGVVKELLLQGENPPEGVEAYTKVKAVYIKGGERGEE
jgi:hypothetical protein